ncbi:ATPase domain of DNA mismatch repair MUTS family, partial [Rhizoctonia solani]
MENSKRSITPSDREESDNEDSRKRVRWNNQLNSSRAPSVERTSISEGGTVSKVFAAVAGYHGRVGGVYFNPENHTLYLMEDTTDSSHFDLIRMFLEQTKVDTCLVSSRSEEDLILFCQDFMELSGGQCQVRPHKEFVAHKGQDKLQQLSLLSRLPQGEPDDSGDAGNSISPRNITGFIDSRRNVENDPNAQQLFTSIRLLNFGGDQAPFVYLSSTAALLEQLPRTRSAEELDETQSHLGALHINSIEILSLDQIMQVNADALASLQVFDDETHASIHSDKTKEGHSLFQLLNHTSTYLGRSLLRRWCLRPSLSITTIDARHAAIQCFLLPENMSAASTIRANLRGLCQMPKTMALLRTGRGRLPEWRGVAKFAYHVNLLKDAVRELSDYENIGAVNQKLLKALDEVNTEETGALVNSVIDWEESQTNQRVCISPGIDEALDEKKRVYNGLDDLLVHVARQVSQNVPEGYTNELNVLYFPQLGKYMDLLRNDLLSFYHQGYLIRIPTPSGWTTHNDFEQIPQWNFQVAKISEIEIMEETLNRVLEYDKKIIAVCEAAAEVDCLLSLSLASWTHSWVRPEMCEDNVIDIRGGTHPLQALLVPTFVDNDAYLVGGQGIGVGKGNYEEAMKSIMICTGANACNQSVYLKQNALIPFMAQV